MHGQYDDRLASRSEVDREWKTWEDRAPGFTPYFGKHTWAFRYSRHGPSHGFCELSTETGTPVLVPNLSLQRLGHSLGAEVDGTCHRLL